MDWNRTYLQDFLDKYPNAALVETGPMVGLPKATLGDDQACLPACYLYPPLEKTCEQRYTCASCWNEEMSEIIKECCHILRPEKDPAARVALAAYAMARTIAAVDKTDDIDCEDEVADDIFRWLRGFEPEGESLLDDAFLSVEAVNDMGLLRQCNFRLGKGFSGDSTPE